VKGLLEVRERTHISSACQEAREQEREQESDRVGPSQRALHTQHTHTFKFWGHTVRRQGRGWEGGREGGQTSGRRERENEGRRDMCGMKPTTRPNTTKITPALIASNFVFKRGPSPGPPPPSHMFDVTCMHELVHAYGNVKSEYMHHLYIRTHTCNYNPQCGARAHMRLAGVAQPALASCIGNKHTCCRGIANCSISVS